MNTTRILACALVGVCAVGAVSHGATYYFTNAAFDNHWSNGDNWKTGNSCTDITGNGNVPSATDNAVICAAECDIDDADAVARTVNVQSNKILEISGGYSLTLGSNNTGSPLTSTVTGTLRLDGGTLRITVENHEFVSNGQVHGVNSGNYVKIDDGRTLTNSTNFSGGMTITNTNNGDHGKFVNDSIVSADNGALIVKPYELDDISSANWRALIFGTLRFDGAITAITGGSLSGKFSPGSSTAVIECAVPNFVCDGKLDMTNGELDVIENLTMGSNTTATLMNFSGGTIKVWAGKTFTHE